MKVSDEQIRTALAIACDDDIAMEYEDRGLRYDYEDQGCDVAAADIIEELQNRGDSYLLEAAYEKYRRGECIDTDLRAIFWQLLGRIV